MHITIYFIGDIRTLTKPVAMPRKISGNLHTYPLLHPKDGGTNANMEGILHTIRLYSGFPAHFMLRHALAGKLRNSIGMVASKSL